MNYFRRLAHSRKDVVRVVRLAGQIQAPKAGELQQNRHVNLQNSAKDLEKAFDVKVKRPLAVLLQINSSGGSAVQSNMIFTRIRHLANKEKIPVVSFVEDAALSGGYWLALAGDKIYADPNSMVGSIGALSAGFGLEELIKKLGIEPRIHSAGANKFRMNPFSPLKEEDREWLKNILDGVHRNFIDTVKERRGSIINTSHKTIFTGDIFMAHEGERIGLIDGLHTDLRQYVDQHHGPKVEIQHVTSTKLSWKSFIRSQGVFDYEQLIDAAVSKAENQGIKLQ